MNSQEATSNQLHMFRRFANVARPALCDEDLREFERAGYTTEFLSWQTRAHRAEARNLLVSENITNSAKLGKRISFHYESNAIFRHLFPEIIPTSSETWSNFSLHQRIPQSNTGSRGHGEGTSISSVSGVLSNRVTTMA